MEPWWSEAVRRALVLTVVLFAATAGAQEDEALLAAAEIRARVETFPAFRAEHELGVWSTVPTWSVRRTTACHAALREAGVAFEPLAGPTHELPIPAPVTLTGPIEGVTFRKLRPSRPVVVACELAARLPAIARLLAAHGVTEGRVLSAWRREPRTSFHTMGLALDLHSFVTTDGELVVEDDYELASGSTCDTTAESERGRALQQIACDLFSSGLVSTVLRPAYSEGHRDHLHVDIRPDDGRAFVR